MIFPDNHSSTLDRDQQGLMCSPCMPLFSGILPTSPPATQSTPRAQDFLLSLIISGVLSLLGLCICSLCLESCLPSVLKLIPHLLQVILRVRRPQPPYSNDNPAHTLYLLLLSLPVYCSSDFCLTNIST